MPVAPRLRTRIVRTLALLALPTFAAIACWFVLEGGRFLDREDPLQHADAMFVLGGTRAERWLEALDLYRAGYAPRIVISPSLVEPAEFEVRRMGIAFPTDAELARAGLIQLGVPASAIVTRDDSVDNTASEAVWLRALAEQYGWQRIIIVTSKYHCRRARFAFRREFAGTPVQIIVRASRHDPSDPAHWLAHRPDIRFALSEWEKLVAYRLGIG